MVLCVARLGVIMQWSNQGYDSGHGWRSGICSKQTGQLRILSIVRMRDPQEGQRPPVGEQLEQISSSHGLMRIVAGFFLQMQQSVWLLFAVTSPIDVTVGWLLVDGRVTTVGLSTGIVRCSSTGIVRCSSAGIVRCSSAGIVRCSSTDTTGCSLATTTTGSSGLCAAELPPLTASFAGSCEDASDPSETMTTGTPDPSAVGAADASEVKQGSGAGRGFGVDRRGSCKDKSDSAGSLAHWKMGRGA